MPLNHAQRFHRLTEMLAEWQSVWRPSPFRHSVPPWSGCFPGRVEQLCALSDADLRQLQGDAQGESVLTDWLPVEELRSLVELPVLPAEEPALPAAWGVHVGGRKWRQIEAFAARAGVVDGEHLVEWCSGKGHLARALSRHHGTRVTALEWQATLCEAGQALADCQGADVHLEGHDVMTPGRPPWVTANSRVVALHACGDLHARLLALAAETRCAVTLAPCCYQRTAADGYRPLSRLGRQLADGCGFELNREDLGLAVQETVTAPRAVSLARERANAWRLGFDALQRRLRGADDYLPVPSLAYGRLPADFSGFCRWAAAQKGLELPDGVDWEGLEHEGERRLAEVSRLELVRHVFRRPLEVWLVLDRVIFLEEAGFDVELGTFCPRELTPRNLLLRTHR